MSEKRANAVGGKTARPCDSCLKKRARWFCAADDAFLCQSCDASIHSANSLAQRHERVRLKTASSSFEACANDAQPAWHAGFRRKARTRSSRPHSLTKLPKIEPPSLNYPLLVPELGEEPLEENEEQLLYRVPIFDPVLAEFCTPPTTEGFSLSSPVAAAVPTDELKPALLADYAEANQPCFIPSDVDLAEFAADVESLLGRGLEEESFCMEGFGLLESRESGLEWRAPGSSRVKVEEEEIEGEEEEAMAYQIGNELEFNFDYDTPTTCEEDEEKVLIGSYVGLEKGGFSLRLDYEAVISAWAGQGPPWTSGNRPQFNPDDSWPDYTAMCGPDLNPYIDIAVGGHIAVGGGDGGREARVSRYREKRRTRLFHKKIRYEVRKLNAEKRPRMKGRFVKRSSFAGPAFPF